MANINLDNIVSYGTGSFANTNVSSFILKTGTSLGDAPFHSNPSLTSLVLNDDLTKIPYGMLMDCTGLTSLYIPASVKEIDKLAFAGCKNLVLTIPDSVETFNYNCFEDVKMVYCTSNSACAKYCEENGVKFKLTDVDPPNASDFEVTFSEESCVYSGIENKPEVTVY